VCRFGSLRTMGPVENADYVGLDPVLVRARVPLPERRAEATARIAAHLERMGG